MVQVSTNKLLSFFLQPLIGDVAKFSDHGTDSPGICPVETLKGPRKDSL